MNKIKLHFLGASRTVTGSKYCVDFNKNKFLIDCGLFQGKKELRNRNWLPLSVPAHEIDAVVLTHAHLDHTGYLPKLVQQGFKGPIYATAATKEITRFILLDSAHLQEEEAKHANKYKTSKHNPAKPLYTTDDAEATLALIKDIPRDSKTEIFKDVHVTPLCSGHILGACSLTFDIGNRRINFSGDVGRYDVPILPDPVPIEFGDLLLCESTYGDRLHSDNSVEDQLADVINQCAKRSGPLLIPSFAVGRTQHLLYIIRKLENEGRIPVVPLYIDSPMAIDATEVYHKYDHDFDSDAKTILDKGENPLLTKKTAFLRTVDESKRLNDAKGPFTVIAGSGMATGGRILHHLIHWLPNPETTVLFVGYQAEETRGARLLSGEPTLKMYGKEIPVKARIENISGLSAHGDKNELLRWLKSSKGTPGQVKIVHGESKVTEIFSKTLRSEFTWKASPAEPEEILELDN